VPEAQTVQAKYIFLDIVGFTHERSIEAQSDIIGVLNRLVREAVEAQDIDKESVIYIPTGDGMCIALLNGTKPLGVHMQIALNILSGVNKHNEKAPDKMREFKTRIGINQNLDNKIVDINGMSNVAGDGISMAQRIMDKADGGQILVGVSVHQELVGREEYMNQWRPFTTEVKHGRTIQVYQYVKKGIPGLNIGPPGALKGVSDTVKGMSDTVSDAFSGAAKVIQKPFTKQG